jgi:hypothetical protein
MSLLLSINQEKPEGVPVPFGAVINRYLAQELPERNSTRYRSWLENYRLLAQLQPIAKKDNIGRGGGDRNRIPDF